MAYEKQTWQTGDVITQEKLNHMEDGIGKTGVSIIKIFESDVTVSANQQFFTGGGSFIGAPFKDTFKGKRPISVVSKVTEPSNNNALIPATVAVTPLNSNGHLDIIGDWETPNWQNVGGGSIWGYIWNGSSTQAKTYHAQIWLVCVDVDVDADNDSE